MTPRENAVLAKLVPPLARLLLGGMLAIGPGLAGAIANANDLRSLLPGIMGHDDRVPVDSTDWPWAAIGRVNQSTGGFCTGTLIGPKLVLTAAHCVYDNRRKRWAPINNVHFLAGYNRGDFLEHALAARIITSDSYIPENRSDDAKLGSDWALIVLRTASKVKPIPLEPLDLRALQAALADGELLRAGYSQDRAHMLAAHVNCSIIGASEEGRLLRHDCDATHGDSGSPLMLRRKGKLSLIAINVAVHAHGDTQIGVAVPVATFQHEAAAAAKAP